MNEITFEYISDYLEGIFEEEKGILGQIEYNARKTDVPIIEKNVSHLLKVLLSIAKPKKILEIGTAVGYSSILMSNYIPDDGKIYTIDRFDIMISQAKINIKNSNNEDKIVLLEGNAEDVLQNFNEQVDLVFMDAAKGKYSLFLEHAIRVIKPGGIIIADDVLYKGMIARSRYSIPRRQRTIHKRMQDFLWQITHDERLETCILPIGDGVAICYVL